MALIQKSFSDIITFTRASGGGRFNAQGQYEWLAADQPRFDFDPVTGEAKGLLIEEQRTNLWLNSAKITLGYNPQAAITTQNYGLAPDGTTSTTRLQTPGGNCVFNLAGHGVSPDAQGTTYTSRLHIKPKSFVGNFDIYAGDSTSTGGVRFTISVSSIGAIPTITNGGRVVPVGNGWFDIHVPYTAGANNPDPNLTFSFKAGSAAADFELWGRGREVGAFATSYIPTTGAQVTRAADVASVNVLSPWFNASEGTLFVEASTFNTGQCELVGLQQDIWNGFRLFRSSAKYASVAFNTGDGQGDGVLGSGENSIRLKVAGTYSDTGYGVSANGRVPNISAAARVGFSPSRLMLGSYATGLSYLNGHIRSLKFYPRRLSNSELQSLTAN